MEHVPSLFDQFSEAAPVATLDFALLTLAIRMACAETPTARIAAGHVPAIAARRRPRRDADRLVGLLAGQGGSRGHVHDGIDAFSRVTAEWRR